MSPDSKIEPSFTAAQMRSAASLCGDVLAEAERRVEARRRPGAHPEAAGCRLVMASLACDMGTALAAWDDLDGRFARVETAADDPRRFVLAPVDAGGKPALLIPIWHGDEADPADLLALDLSPGSKRFWRLTRVATAWAASPEAVQPRPNKVQLRGDAHETVRCWAAVERARGRGLLEAHKAFDAAYWRLRTDLGVADVAACHALAASDPRREAFRAGLAACWAARDAAQDRWALPEPAGALVLEPSAFDWTKRGLLKGVEDIEILDQPANGPLGRALTKLNPRIGGPLGVSLTGVSADAFKRRAA